MRRWFWRAIGVVVTAGLAATTATCIAIWRDERDLQRHGTRAHVLVLSRHDERRSASAVRVRMPDGTAVTIDTFGPARPGQQVEVVYWPDDPAHAEFPGWPTAVAALSVAIGGFVALIALAILYGLVVPPLRRRRRARSRPAKP
jgi:hypothetical protein